MKRAERDRIGATRGKLALVGVLAVVLVWVLASNFRGTAEVGAPRPKAADSTRRRRSAPEARTTAKKTTTKTATPSTGPFGEFAADANWPEAPLEQVINFDPFAAPEWIAAGEQAAAAAEGRGDQSLEQLQQAQNAIILITGNQRVARIGSQDYHVGDMVGQFQITDISSAGIVLSEPIGDASEPK